MVAQVFLKDDEQRIFFEYGRFERVVELTGCFREIASLQYFRELLRATGFAVERSREPREIFISPRGRNAKSRMNQQKCRAAQRLERLKRNDFFATAGGQRRFGLEKERNIGTQFGCERVKLRRGEWFVEQFVQAAQSRCGVAA